MSVSHVLLVDDDEEALRLTRMLLAESGAGAVAIDWAPTYQRGLSSLLEGSHAVALIDYHLGARSGIDLLRDARARGCTTPLIMLTGRADDRVDLEAMDAGADDYLVKGQVTGALLERSLRYAVERRRAVERLKGREEHLLALIEDSAAVIALLDRAGTVLFVSESVERGDADPPPIVGRNTFDLIHPDDRAGMRAAYDRCLAAPGNRIYAEYRAKHRDGTWRHQEVMAVNRLDNPAVRAVVLNSRDVTDRKRTQAQREFLATIVESSEDAILGVTLDGIIVSWNPSAERLYGYTSAEMVGQPEARIVPPDRPDEVPEILARLRHGESIRQFETVRIARNGRRIDVSMTISPICDAAGAVTGLSSVAHDISGRMRAEEELRRTTGHLRALLSCAPTALWALDPDGVITLAEGQLLKRLGLPTHELVGQSLFDVYRDSPEVGEATRRALGGEACTVTLEIRGIVLDTWYSPIRHADGRFAGAIGVALDVSERHRLESQLRQSQKIEAVGRLAGGVAHDFNNLLTAILGFAEMASAQLAPGDPARGDVQQIVNAGQSAASLTRQLLAFSRKQILEPQIVDVNALVGGMQTLLRRVIGEDVELVTVLADRLSRITADPGQLEQVIMNLAVNARDALPSGGTLSITTDIFHVDEGFVAAHAGAVIGPQVRLTLTDTGLGMSPEVLAHVFEPFFTTKEPGKGTGLGLATVYGIVKQSGGYIWVESTPGHGTSFMINFPAASIAAPVVAAPVRAPQGFAGTETILVVEDQQEVRDVVRQTLQRHGYVVLEAVDGHAALALLHGRRGAVHLLLTDVVMPYMSGRELVDRATRDDSSMRVLYTSGYTDDAIVRHGGLDPGIDFLPKPFSPNQLVARVRAVLDRIG